MVVSSWLRRVALVSVVLLLVAAVGCEREAPPSYKPGLGEIMAATQMRHSKLWFAGSAGNWALAAYELDELKEGFDDAVRFHPTHKGAPVAELLPEMTAEPLAQLETAVSAKETVAFESAFDTLTAACNACHEAAHFEFNVVKRPTSNPFTNQKFEPPKQMPGPQ